MNYSEKYLRALDKVLRIEGGYVDDEDDKGGKTNFGVTLETARKGGYEGDMENITMDDVTDIYFNLFWEPTNLDEIKNSKISSELFEFGINAGMGTAVKVLQRAYNVLNKNDILVEDGVFGSVSVGKINNYKFYKSLFKTMNILQGMYYLALAENDEELKDNIKNHKETKGGINKKFVRGWIDKRVFI